MDLLKETQFLDWKEQNNGTLQALFVKHKQTGDFNQFCKGFWMCVCTSQGKSHGFELDFNAQN